MKKLRSVSLPCLVIAWTLTVIFCGAFIYSLYEAYCDHYCEVTNDMEQNLKTYNQVCRIPETKVMYSKTLKIPESRCIEIEHILHRDPRRTAMIRTIKDTLGICMTNECQSVMSGIGYLMELVFVLIVVTVLILSICGCQLVRLSDIAMKSKDLPGNHINTKKAY